MFADVSGWYMARVQSTPTIAEKKSCTSGDVKIRLRIVSAHRRASSRIIIVPLRAVGMSMVRGISSRAGEAGEERHMTRDSRSRVGRINAILGYCF
jgi:hypothetical protein